MSCTSRLVIEIHTACFFANSTHGAIQSLDDSGLVRFAYVCRKVESIDNEGEGICVAEKREREME